MEEVFLAFEKSGLEFFELSKDYEYLELWS